MIGKSAISSRLLKSAWRGTMAVSLFWAGHESGQYPFHAASVLKHQNNKMQPPMGFEVVVCTLVYERGEFTVAISEPPQAYRHVGVPTHQTLGHHCVKYRGYSKNEQPSIIMKRVVEMWILVMMRWEGGAASVSALYKPRHLADLPPHHTDLLSYQRTWLQTSCLTSSEQPPKHFKTPTDLFDVSSIASRLGKSSFAFDMHFTDIKTAYKTTM